MIFLITSIAVEVPVEAMPTSLFFYSRDGLECVIHVIFFPLSAILLEAILSKTSFVGLHRYPLASRET